MENKIETLEEKAKTLINLKIRKISFKLTDIKPLQKYVSSLNYLVEKGYVLEKGETIDELYYEVTPEGVNWAKS